MPAPKPAFPRVHRRDGAPSLWLATEGPRRTFAADAGDVADLARGSRAAVRSGGCSWAAGDRGPCLSFDGATGSARASSAAPLANPAGEWTISARFAVASVAGTDRQSILSFGGDDTGGWTGRLFTIGPQLYGDVVYFGNPKSASVLVAGRAYTAALVRTANAMALYLDGALCQSIPIDGRTLRDTSNLTLGMWPTVGQYLAGTVDDARVYPRALSAAEVAREAADPYWRLRPTRRRSAPPPPYRAVRFRRSPAALGSGVL